MTRDAVPSKPAKRANAISPTRSEDYAEWYQQVIKEADLAENSPVRGCMVIRPWGYGLWENIQQGLDRMFKDTGHQNAYFPLFIPLSFFEKEAEHVEGFAKECAVVTHRRLEARPGGGLVPAAELEEPLVVRPTSETIIGASFAKWIRSYRDLPVLINQWANVVRWEMRTRLFLRTTEFLWQEGHTAHATAEEARAETMRMLDIYERFAQEYMAIPVIKGEKCSWERFPGAVNTYSIEAMMQDRRALQAGTSHFLGQNFARASAIRFQTKEGAEDYAWTTSWGVSTRLIGALIMSHSDDDGLVLPPRLAPRHVVMLPIYRNDADRERVLEYCRSLATELRDRPYGDGRLQVDIDDRDIRGGEKTWHHVKRGVPLRLEIGPRDLDAGVVSVSRRDRHAGERIAMPRAEFVARAGGMLEEMQRGLFERALAFRDGNTREIVDRSVFEEWFRSGEDERQAQGGFALCPFADDPAIVDALAPLKVTVRCLPLDQQPRPAKCLFSGQATDRWAIFAKAY
ncbi:MAG: proline--tRNA ligase [Gammaproteobacteria bacterium]|nr:proline--tRNA ligase [Gammaproteobacteria bacterium]